VSPLPLQPPEEVEGVRVDSWEPVDPPQWPSRADYLDHSLDCPTSPERPARSEHVVSAEIFFWFEEENNSFEKFDISGYKKTT